MKAPAAKKEWKCEIATCGKKFRSIAGFWAHTNQHKQLFKCAVSGCGRSCGSQRLLDVHMCSHTKTRAWVCGEPNCKAKFVQQSKLKRHHQMKHLQLKKFVCT